MKNHVQLDFASETAFVICKDLETGDETTVEIDLDCLKIVDAATDGLWIVSRTNPTGKTRYCMANKDGRTLYMHRCLCLNIEQGLEAAHLDGNGLNNRRDNLRALTKSDHRKMDGLRHPKPNRGVRKVKSGTGFRACIAKKNLGMYSTEQAADQAAELYRAQLFETRQRQAEAA